MPTSTSHTVRPFATGDPEIASTDVVASNVDQLRALFPEAFTEGAIDFEVLRQLLGDTVDQSGEKYGLTWHGKRQARQLALTPSTGTLLPQPQESVDWDTTKNLVIEGDNLEVLKLLQKSYASKVKLIYIDPPYNTGKDFVYPDDYRDSMRNYLAVTRQVDAEGRRLGSNTEASGRFHTDWLNMMYPRLKLARNLLTRDGVVLVSIDDREVANLRLICDDVFGEENFIGTIVWKGATDNNPTRVAVEHEYLLCFARSAGDVATEWKNSTDDAKQTLLSEFGRLRRHTSIDNDELQRLVRRFIKSNRESLDAVTHYDRVDDEGLYTGSRKVHNPKPGGYVYDVIHPVTNRACVAPVNGYRYPESRMRELEAAGRILFGTDDTQIVQIKEYLADYEGKLSSVINLDSRAGSNELFDLFGVQKLFTNPKPTALLSELFEFVLADGDIVLDFFAGSGSTAHAVMQLNARGVARANYILVQLPEPLDASEKDQRVAADFCGRIGKPANIAELTKERVRRASQQVFGAQHEAGVDAGFRVFRLANSNVRAWAPDPDDLAGTLLENADHLVRGRSEQDVLFELLLKLGLNLTVPIETAVVAGHDVHSVGGGALFACLTPSITRAGAEPLAEGIAALRARLAPAGETQVVLRDAGFVDDVAKANLAAILAQHGITNVRSL